MKNIIKKMVVIVVVLTTLVCLSGFTYQTEEVPTALIKELVSNGFTMSEDDDNIWLIEMDEEDLDAGEYATVYGRFDTDENIGTVTIVGKFTNGGKVITYQSYVVTWDNIEGEMVTLAEFEY